MYLKVETKCMSCLRCDALQDVLRMGDACNVSIYCDNVHCQKGLGCKRRPAPIVFFYVFVLNNSLCIYKYICMGGI